MLQTGCLRRHGPGKAGVGGGQFDQEKMRA